jgi:hypothetical protein
VAEIEPSVFAGLVAATGSSATNLPSVNPCGRRREDRATLTNADRVHAGAQANEMLVGRFAIICVTNAIGASDRRLKDPAEDVPSKHEASLPKERPQMSFRSLTSS